MKNILNLPFYILAYKLFRRFGYPRLLPINVTIWATNKCDSHCKTCNIWNQKRQKELSVEEWKKILITTGRTPLWFTIIGGEPFLRDDLDKIISIICEYNRPVFINISTNALNTKKIGNMTVKILKVCETFKTRLTINVSIDEIEQKYDYLRGTIDGFTKVLKTVLVLQQIQRQTKYLNIGVNIVISKYNVERLYDIFDYIYRNIRPNTIVTEIATPRKLFYLHDEKIKPGKVEYLKILDFLISSHLRKKNLTSYIVNKFRKRYYKLLKENIISDKKIPCYAGIASAEILANGEVVSCCMLGESLGNLREYNYDFSMIWKSKSAEIIRNRIKNDKCFCSLANTFYTNRIIYGNI